jgi:hypothetical protein
VDLQLSDAIHDLSASAWARIDAKQLAHILGTG